MSIFETKAEMPPKDNSSDVVRVAQTMAEVHAQNLVPAIQPTNRDVKNIDRPRRGHDY